MKEIDEEEYEKTITALTKKKWDSLTGHEAIKRKKVFEYCYRKGYEANIINMAIAKCK